jgi:hypothetical protein
MIKMIKMQKQALWKEHNSNNNNNNNTSEQECEAKKAKYQLK